MKIVDIYKDVISRTDIWDYYNKGIIAPQLSDPEDCYRFITEYIVYSEKSKTVLFEGIGYLREHAPRRLTHIVSTFFLGLWLFNHKRKKFVRESIKKELKELACFQDDVGDIDRQFTYVWFMATLFHDLGYIAEDKKGGISLPNHYIHFVDSVPRFYSKVYERYFCFRENKEHGIYAGLKFDREICDIRKFEEHNELSRLSWREELEELYHYVAWIILAHNIWMIRDDDKDCDIYQNNGLIELILSSERDLNGDYKEYKFCFNDYPFFVLFCIIDSIEPIKSTSCLSVIDIKFQGKKIIIKSNDAFYRKKVTGLNDWLLPVSIDNDVVTIWLDDN